MKNRIKFLGRYFLLAFLLYVNPYPIFAQGTGGVDTSENPRIIAKTLYNGAVDGNYYAADSQHFYYSNGNTKLYTNYLRYIFYNLNAWTKYNNYSFIYDTNGNKTQFKVETYTNSTAVDFISRWNWTYNSANQKLTELYDYWPSGGSAWQNRENKTYTYDVAGNLINMLTQKWVNGAWENFQQVTTTYNLQHNGVSSILQNWKVGVWVNILRYDLTYDAAGIVLNQSIKQEWDLNNNRWNNYGRYNYTYNTSGKITLKLGKGWDTAINNWGLGTVLTTYTYDNAGNLLDSLQQLRNPDNTLDNIRRDRFTYNSHNQILTQDARNAHNNAFPIYESCGLTTYYYNEVPTSITNPTNGGVLLAVYPNPANYELHISLKWSEPQAFTATITDMAGRVCSFFSAPATPSFTNTLSIAHLPASNYLLSIRGSKGSETVQTISVRN